MTALSVASEAGLRVDVHEAIEKPDGIILRCRMRGRRLESAYRKLNG
jgi:hypothetical protein